MVVRDPVVPWVLSRCAPRPDEGSRQAPDVGVCMMVGVPFVCVFVVANSCFWVSQCVCVCSLQKGGASSEVVLVSHGASSEVVLVSHSMDSGALV